MAYYDNFYTHVHPGWAQKLLVRLNKCIVEYVLQLFPYKGSLQILEVGPGKGYFYQACCAFPRLDYHACDQNRLILANLPLEKTFQATVPPLPNFEKKFDIIYCAYLIEHLTNGHTVHEFIESCDNALRPGGLLVLLTPDAFSQKFEFWNMDYTHSYPTTARNITMILRENGFERLKVFPINGLLTVKNFTSIFVYWILRLALFFYNYRVAHAILGWLFKTKLHAANNPFYQFYCLAKQRNLIFIAQKRS